MAATEGSIETEGVVASALVAFYLENNLPLDGGKEASFVKIHVNRWLSIYIPNFPGRKRALLKHDIHHLVTGYSASSLSGESEISAWEIASGCKAYWGAFLINTCGALIGITIDVRKVFRAFVNGRGSKNLYHHVIAPEEALKMDIGELRLLLETDPEECRPVAADRLSFACFCVFGLVYSIFLAPAVPLIIAYTVYIRIFKIKTS